MVLLINFAFSQTDSVPDYVPESQPQTLRQKPQKDNSTLTARNFKTVHKTNPFALIVGNTIFNGELRYMNETVLARKFTLVLSAS